jgi:hypothetical protein
MQAFGNSGLVRPKPRLPLYEALAAALVTIALLALDVALLATPWRWIADVLIVAGMVLALRRRAFRER